MQIVVTARCSRRLFITQQLYLECQPWPDTCRSSGHTVNTGGRVLAFSGHPSRMQCMSLRLSNGNGCNVLPGGREGAAVFVDWSHPGIPLRGTHCFVCGWNTEAAMPVYVLRECGFSKRRLRDTSSRSSEVEGGSLILVMQALT